MGLVHLPVDLGPIRCRTRLEVGERFGRKVKFSYDRKMIREMGVFEAAVCPANSSPIVTRGCHPL